MKEVYVVIEHWKLNWEEEYNIHSFSTYQKAKRFYDNCIRHDMSSGISCDSFQTDNVEFCGEHYINDNMPSKRYALEEVNVPQEGRYLHIWHWFQKEDPINICSSYYIERCIIDEDKI